MPFSLTSEQKQTLLWFVLGIALLALLVELGPILAPFIAAAILAYALNPAVDFLSRPGRRKLALPRPLAVVAVLLAAFAVVGALLLIIVPVVQKEVPLLQEQIPALLAKLNATVGPKLREYGIVVRLDGTGVKRLLSKYVASSGDELWATLLASVKVGGLRLLGWLVTLALVPVALFYLLLDWHALMRRVAESIPRRWVGTAADIAREIDSLLAQYLRGQLAVMLILCVYYAICLGIAGFDVALPVGIITGLLIFIPYVGFSFGLALASVAALLQFDGLRGLVAVAIIYGLGQVIEGFFLTPRLVGERIGLHPLAVIFALLAFGQLFGFVGVLLALPASAALSVGYRRLRNQYLNSSFYLHS
ncbi:AI-2E family transporter [Oxalobacteraceae bacterium OM1]|nr:AI-2E family transporter [Oxalobacteraceae bacterium OM1]